jgi:hypothetical protein
VLQGGGRDHEIGAVVVQTGAERAPAPCRCQIKRQNSLAIEGQYPIEPSCERAVKDRVYPALSRNAALDLANADDAEEKIGRSLPLEPRHDHRIASSLAKLG